MSAVDRVARAIQRAYAPPSPTRMPALESEDIRAARAALAAIRPMDAEAERAVALASCERGLCAPKGKCQDIYSVADLHVACLTRARRTVDALVKAMGRNGDV